MSSYIFLDHITTKAHVALPQDRTSSTSTLMNNNGVDNTEEELWRKTLIQPVAIPDLDHLNVRTMIAPNHNNDNAQNSATTAEPVLRPDGAVTAEFRKQIWKQMQELPRVLVVDEKDVKWRDESKYSKQNDNIMNNKKRF